MTVKQAIKFGHNALRDTSPTSLTDTKVILQHVLQTDRTKLQQKMENLLTDGQFRAFQEYLSKRQKNEPIAYIIGHKEFYGIDFYVDERVLIPRPETELLVEKTLSELGKRRDEKLLFVDIGTGSGNIACTIARLAPLLPVVATDISKEAVLVAKRNARTIQVSKQIDFRVGSMLVPLSDKEISENVIVMCANLPYVPVRYNVAPDIHYEPELAIFAGPDGTEIYEEFLDHVAERPFKDLTLFLEIDHDQGKPIRDLIAAKLPGASTTVAKDYLGHDRIVRVELRKLLVD
jgi:release factor glutamine methyltransferase